MNRYHYIDDQGNISDVLPLEALRKIDLPPTTKVLPEGGKQWISLAEVSQGGPVVFPAPPLPPPTAATPPPPANQSPVAAPPPPTPSSPSPGNASKFYPTFFLGVFLGVFGAHRFYVRKIGTGVLQLVTFGGLGIWWLVDMIMILVGKFKDKSGAVIPNIAPKLSWSVFAVVVIIGLASRGGDSGSSTSSSSGGSSSSTSSGWGSSLERKLVGIYECASPMWVIQLKSGGGYAMEALDTGNRYSGTWAASGDSGILKPDVGASLTFTIYSDGALKIDKYGYTFVRTR